MLHSRFSKWFPFLLLHFVAILLLSTWLWPVTRAYWDVLDVAAFRFLNENIVFSPLAQVFWAIANVKCVDLFGAAYMATFFLIYVFEGTGEERAKRLAQFFYLCIWGEIGILSSKEGISWILKNIDFMRDSPSVVLYCPVFLSHAAPWLNVKDFSHFSFPSDHAIIVMQWAGFIWFFCGKRLGILATFSAIFFSLPRLVAGAHWLTDAFVGSLSIILVILAWATFTPIYSFSMKYLIKLTSKIIRKPKNAAPHDLSSI